MRLSPNFTLAEMTRSSTAEKRGIDNSLSPGSPEHASIIDALRNVCTDILEPCRAHFGKPIRPTSGYRSPALNRAIGGSPRSQHMTGNAVDFEIAGVANADIVQFIRDNLVFDKIVAEKIRKDDPSAGWVHVSYNIDNNRGELVSWLGGRDYRMGLHYVG